MSDKLKPDWAGEDWLSRFVNLLIQNKPIYKAIKHQARQLMIRTAEKKGIPWRQNCLELERSGAKELMAEIVNEKVVYPDYYRVPFHAYEEGNMCWQAACEAPAATQSMALRIWPKENLTAGEAHARLRHSFHSLLEEYGPAQVRDVVDIGCSVGISTLELHRYYSQKQETPVRTVGLDLSPYMLSVARIRDEKKEIARWLHARAEDTGLPDNSFDLVTLQFVLHELPHQATKTIFTEALRILRRGGCLAIVDNNPLSPVIQSLPPALFVLMKSTEPWTDDYYTFNVEAALEEVGFDYRATIPSDPRHRTIIAFKPQT